MQQDIKRVLIDRQRIEARVKQLAQEIAGVYGGHELVLVGLLTGSIIFLADLVRQLPMRMRIDVLVVSSYPGRATRSQGPQVLYPPALKVAGRHVLIVDDILDSGRTLEAVRACVLEGGAVSVRSCVLLRKPAGSAGKLDADWVGFDIPDAFVVGYGLDYNHLYRNLPEIVELQDHVLECDLESAKQL